MRTVGSILLRVLLHLAAVSAATVVMHGAMPVEWRMAGLAIATAAVGPIWLKRCTLRARLAACLVGLAVAGVLPLVVLPVAMMLGRDHAVSLSVLLVAIMLTLALAGAAGLVVPTMLLRRWRRRSTPAISLD